ncbi:glucan synthase [Actinoplanes campanulatus]|nr:glucan synthase [Actinoplanes campanulatus]GID35917.1 glucan synthase [Actinoplanes campanulatus]
MSDVTAAWIRIERWLGRHAPGGLSVLAPPATRERIAGTGLAMPDELVESLLRHDGLTRWANLLPEGVPLSAAGVAEAYEIRMDVAEDVDGFTVHPPNDEPWWHERWIPFSTCDVSLLVIDLRDGPGHGRLGIAPTSNPAYFDEGWPSLGAYLTAVADGLESGAQVGPWHAYLIGGGELWWGLAGETEVNGEPLRPAPWG